MAPVHRKKPAAKPRNYAATEATLINVRKLKARVTRVEDELAILQSRVDALEPRAPFPTGESEPVDG